jgi:SAM-dependent methyltransferase
MLRLLAARGVLEQFPGAVTHEFRARGPSPTTDLAAVRDEQLQHDPSWMPSYVLAETVAQDYPAFLRGDVVGEEVLFSPGRLRLWVDYFSNQNGLYAVNNRIGAAAVEQWLPLGGGVVVELGGGLGSGAIAVLERLGVAGRAGAIQEYRFTELVPAFLRRGEQALRVRRPESVPIRFDILDMNQAFEAQGIAPSSVTAVYAVNTLHVAHDLDFTLGQILRTLRPGGWLIVSECVQPVPEPGHLCRVHFQSDPDIPISAPASGLPSQWWISHPRPVEAGDRIRWVRGHALRPECHADPPEGSRFPCQCDRSDPPELSWGIAASRERVGLAARYSLMIPPHVRRSTRSKPLACSTSRIVAGGTHWSIVSQ